MTDTIEPGDLIRVATGAVMVAQLHHTGAGETKLIAKGPGWTRHDGSSVNPVPGAECEVRGSMGENYDPDQSDTWTWSLVQFYRVTREAPSQPPAPQPGWVATVTLEWISQAGKWATVRWPNDQTVTLQSNRFDALDWQPPPRPAPVLRVGGKALTPTHVEVEVMAIADQHVWTRRTVEPTAWGTYFFGELTPLEDEGQ